MSNRFWNGWRKLLGGVERNQDFCPTSNEDLRRGLAPLALPDESEHMAEGEAPIESDPEIVMPGPHGQVPGSAVHG